MDRLTRVVVTGRNPTFMNTHTDSFTVVNPLQINDFITLTQTFLLTVVLYTHTDDADCLPATVCVPFVAVYPP